MMIANSTTHAITESLATAYGKNGFPCDFRIEYSLRYASFSRAFTSDLVLVQALVAVGLQPRRGGGAELGDQVQVRADQGGDRARQQHHVDRVEARQRRRTELRAAAEEVRQVRADDRTRAVDVHAHDR